MLQRHRVRATCANGKYNSRPKVNRHTPDEYAPLHSAGRGQESVNIQFVATQ